MTAQLSRRAARSDTVPSGAESWRIARARIGPGSPEPPTAPVDNPADTGVVVGEYPALPGLARWPEAGP